MQVFATLVISMTLDTVSLEALVHPSSSPLAPLPLALLPPQSPTLRRRSPAAAALRRARAIALGYFIPIPSAPNKAYVEVPKTLKPQIKDMVRGKILKAIREDQVGTPAHSTRLATLAAHKANFTTKEEFQADTRIVKRQNAANHGSPKSNLKAAPWADYDSEEDNNEISPSLANIIANTLDKWWVEKNFLKETSPPSIATKSAASQTDDETVAEPPNHYSHECETSTILPIPPIAPPPIPQSFGHHASTREAVFALFGLDPIQSAPPIENSCENDTDEKETIYRTRQQINDQTTCIECLKAPPPASPHCLNCGTPLDAPSAKSTRSQKKTPQMNSPKTAQDAMNSNASPSARQKGTTPVSCSSTDKDRNSEMTLPKKATNPSTTTPNPNTSAHAKPTPPKTISRTMQTNSCRHLWRTPLPRTPLAALKAAAPPQKPPSRFRLLEACPSTATHPPLLTSLPTRRFNATTRRSASFDALDPSHATRPRAFRIQRSIYNATAKTRPDRAATTKAGPFPRPLFSNQPQQQRRKRKQFPKRPFPQSSVPVRDRFRS